MTKESNRQVFGEGTARQVRAFADRQLVGDPYHGCAARYLDRSIVRRITDVAVQRLRQVSVSWSFGWRAMNAIATGIGKLAAWPRTKREKDLAALTLFCLLSVTLIGLIAVGMF